MALDRTAHRVALVALATLAFAGLLAITADDASARSKKVSAGLAGSGQIAVHGAKVVKRASPCKYRSRKARGKLTKRQRRNETRRVKRCRKRNARAATSAAGGPLYWGRLDRESPDRDRGALGHERGRQARGPWPASPPP